MKHCVSHMGRKVEYHSPAGSPQQGDPKVSASDEAEYQAAMKGLKGPAAPAAPSAPAPADDDVSKQIYKSPPANKGGYFKLPKYLGGS